MTTYPTPPAGRPSDEGESGNDSASGTNQYARDSSPGTEGQPSPSDHHNERLTRINDRLRTRTDDLQRRLNAANAHANDLESLLDGMLSDRKTSKGMGKKLLELSEKLESLREQLK
jgi:predicted RNase H-like nuclease (RuvC/YqgF family)